MAPPLPVKKKTPFELWKDTIDRSKGNEKWAAYDQTIQETVAAYNGHLQLVKGYSPLDWKLIKAMVWTESGGPTTTAWITRPIQIGNSGDPGLKALLSGREGGELILPLDMKGTLTEDLARSRPVENIQAGVGYLLMRLANFANRNVEDEADTVHDYVVKPGDSFDRIARKNESTIEELQLLNPSAKTLRIGQAVKVRKAKIRKVIIGFKTVSNAMVAKLYNTKDTKYAEKLAYCLAVMP